MSRVKPIRQGFPALEWLEEATGSHPRVMLAGSHRALIENHTGILEFTPTQIRLLTKHGILTLTGQNLMLSEVRPDALTVRGEITSIQLPPQREEAPHGT